MADEDPDLALVAYTEQSMGSSPAVSSMRILLIPPGRRVIRSAIDWVAERQRHSRVIVPPSVRVGTELPPRVAREPFTDPDATFTGIATKASALLGGTGASTWAVEAAALALLHGGAVLATDPELFPDLIPLSSWSMNVQERPTDGLLVQHLGIAGRMPAAFRDAAPEALAALGSGEAAQCARVARARRLRARADGPRRFRRIAPRSAGRRPFLVYLDLFPLTSPAGLAAAGSSGPGGTGAGAIAPGSAAAAWIEGLDRNTAEALLSTAAAVFI